MTARRWLAGLALGLALAVLAPAPAPARVDHRLEVAAEPPLGAPRPALVDGLRPAAVAPTGAAPGWGLADQLPPSLDHELITTLGLRHARLIVPWDVVPRASADQRYEAPAREEATGRPVGPRTLVARAQPARLALVDLYLRRAQARGMEVLVSFERSAGTDASGRFDLSGVLPTLAQYEAATEAFRDRYRAMLGPRGVALTVRELTAWNEPNQGAQPTSGSLPDGVGAEAGARAAGAYWRSLRARCAAECVVAAGDLLDLPDLPGYLRRYRAALGGAPEAWALHAYHAGLDARAEGVDRFLAQTGSAPVWLTEQGPLYHKPEIHDDTALGDRSLRFLLALAQARPRITRFYYYALRGNPVTAAGRGFDSGFLDVNHGDRLRALPDGRGPYASFSAAVTGTGPGTDRAP